MGENVINNDAPESQYRNPFLANAMVNLNMIDTSELTVVGELTDELLLGVDLEDLGGGAEVAMAEPVHDDGVAIGETFDGAGEVEWIIDDLVAADIPDDLAGFVVFHDAVAFAEGDEPVARADRRTKSIE